MPIAVPRDREGSFAPQLVKKRQRRLSGVDDLAISLSAKGLTHGEISAHLVEVYDAQLSKQTITAITDRVLEGLSEWQNRRVHHLGTRRGSPRETSRSAPSDPDRAVPAVTLLDR